MIRRTNLFPVCDFTIAVYTVTDKRPSQRMRPLLAVPFERTASRGGPSVVAERNLQQVRLRDVTVPHEDLPNPETIAASEQKRHLMSSMSSGSQSASVTTSSVRMKCPFPTPTTPPPPSPRHTTAHSAAQSSSPPSLRKLVGWYITYAFGDTNSLNFVPGTWL